MRVSVSAEYNGLIVNSMNKGSMSDQSSRELRQLIIHFNSASELFIQCILKLP